MLRLSDVNATRSAGMLLTIRMSRTRINVHVTSDRVVSAYQLTVVNIYMVSHEHARSSLGVNTFLNALT